MKILNLYAGIGGNRKLWHKDHKITNVEINPQLCEQLRINFPNDTTIEHDAMDYLIQHYHKFDFIWASPPCQTHSRINRINSSKYHRHEYIDPSLYQIIIFLQENFQGGYIVENVIPYYGQAFSPTIYGRHSFWSNYDIQCLNWTPTKQNLFDLQLNDLQSKFQIFIEKNIYLNESHDPKQIFRNAVDPQLGNLLLQRFNKKSQQLSLFQPGGEISGL